MRSCRSRADVKATDKKLDGAGLNKEPAKLVKTGVIADIRRERGNLGTLANSDIKKTRSAQKKILKKASGKQNKFDQAAVTAMTKQRVGAIRDNFAHQARMAKSEEKLRELFSKAANGIMSTTQTAVEGKLTQLRKDARTKWNKGIAPAKDIQKYIKALGSYVEKRYSGVGGFFRNIGDSVTGKKSKLRGKLSKAERDYANAVCKAAEDVSSEIETVIDQCKQLIDTAKRNIDGLIKVMPLSAQAWARSQKVVFDKKLGTLSTNVQKTRDQLTTQMMVQAVESVNAVQKEVEAIRQKTKNVLEKIADFVSDFVDDPVKAIINGLLDLAGIPRPSFWALVEKIKKVVKDISDDPKKFGNNLMKALGMGFDLFFKNFGKHLKDALFRWLFSRLDSVGVSAPKDFSLKSIITFILQIMGITWPKIRKLLVKHAGERNVALVEKAYELIKLFMDKGPEGIFKMLKEKLNPKTLLDQILQAAVNYVIEQVVKTVSARVAAMFFPLTAIVQAIEMIYKVVKWVLDNAARIFKLVDTVVNGVVDILKGNIGGMAKKVESALAQMMVPVIDFLAGLANLGGLPDKVKDVIGGFQAKVEAILDKVIGFMVKKAKALLAKLAGKGKKEKGKANQIGKTVRFKAGKKSHKLWIVKKGKKPVVKMASVETEVEDLLTKTYPAMIEGYVAKTKQKPLFNELNNEVRPAWTALVALAATEISDAERGDPIDQTAVTAKEQKLATEIQPFLERLEQNIQDASVHAKRFEAARKTLALKPVRQEAPKFRTEASGGGKAYTISSPDRFNAPTIKAAVKSALNEDLGAGAYQRMMEAALRAKRVSKVNVASRPEYHAVVEPTSALAGSCLLRQWRPTKDTNSQTTRPRHTPRSVLGSRSGHNQSTEGSVFSGGICHQQDRGPGHPRGRRGQECKGQRCGGQLGEGRARGHPKCCGTEIRQSNRQPQNQRHLQPGNDCGNHCSATQ